MKLVFCENPNDSECKELANLRSALKVDVISLRRRGHILLFTVVKFTQKNREKMDTFAFWAGKRQISLRNLSCIVLPVNHKSLLGIVLSRRTKE